jgi:hypothetical protein
MSEPLVHVLAHPLRDRVLFEYQGEPTSPARVARRIRRPVNLVSYHTRVLVRHGCLALVRTERRQGALEHFYRSTVGQLVSDDDWAGVPTPLQRVLALGTVRILDEEAREAAASGGFDGPRAVLIRKLLRLDDDGIAAVSHVLQRAFDEVERIASESGSRPGARRAEVALLAFERADEPAHDA